MDMWGLWISGDVVLRDSDTECSALGLHAPLFGSRTTPMMPYSRRLAKSIIVTLLGQERRPRKVLRGLAAGYRICVSPRDNLGYLLGTTEPHLQRAIRRYVSDGDTVYDIGANIGYVSLSFAKRVGSKGRVFAFEPIPETFDLLAKNVELNKLNNIKTLNVAASDSTGETIIRIPRSLSMSSLVWHHTDPSAVELSIKTVVIDELVKAGELPSPKFVKIDVEGAEGLVVQGMRDTIANTRPVLFLECSDIGRQTTWQLLSELGYQCSGAASRKRIETFEDYRHSDFLWLPTHSDN
jgi:FkbM family methyltransferase